MLAAAIPSVVILVGLDDTLERIEQVDRFAGGGICQQRPGSSSPDSDLHDLTGNCEALARQLEELVAAIHVDPSMLAHSLEHCDELSVVKPWRIRRVRNDLGLTETL